MSDGSSPATGRDDLARIRGMVDAHETWRRQTVNLIASENVISPAVRAALDSDLEGRYADYPGRDLRERRYRGNRHIVEIEEYAAELARTAFRAEHVELRPLAGHLAGVAVLMGLCRPGDTILEIGRDGGGHREAGRLATSQFGQLDVRYLPFNGSRYNVDVPATLELIEATHPRMVILGSSNFLFPHPVRDLVAAVHGFGGYVAFDGSHVMGFLATNRFQDPLPEGADLVFGSTHKTFPGPQGGIIYTNREDLIDQVATALVPALVTNHHPFRMPGLAVALLEMATFGAAYMDAVVANSTALGEALARHGVASVQVGGVYSLSHCLLARVSEFGTAPEVAARLEEAGIITTSALLPDVQGVEGIRIGVQEMTRRGASPATMDDIARLFAVAVDGSRDPRTIAVEAAQLVGSLGPLRFTFA